MFSIHCSRGALPASSRNHIVMCVDDRDLLKDVTLAVLAGGAGTRMGFPKQHLQISGKPVAWPGPTLLVTTPGREHPAGWSRYDTEAVDATANQGPLRGIHTALEHSETDSLVITTVDMPGLMQSQLAMLIGSLMVRPELHGVMFQRRIHGESVIEPFPFACRRNISATIATRLAGGRRSIHSLAEILGFELQPAPADWPPMSWTNLNSPQDLQVFIRSLQG
jgi:molybdopterin-guanine dinucleotide biosynthesis protein A